MKRLIFVLLCIAMLCTPAAAHSGRTDANGGHTDSSTGEYHYHHGYPAHQHKDMDGDGTKDCPYEFDDKTGSTSGNSGSGKGGTSVKEVEVIKEVPVIPNSHRFWEAILIAAIVIAVGRIVIISADRKTQTETAEHYRNMHSAEAKKCEDLAKQLGEKSNELHSANVEISWKQSEIDGLYKQMDAARIAADRKIILAQKEADEKVETYKALLAEKMGAYPLLTIAKAPKHITIGADGRPCVKDASKDWGADCTYYVASSTWKTGRGVYHRYECQVVHGGYSQAFPMHFTKVHGNGSLLPCKLCIPEQRLPKWQTDYIAAESLFKI